MSIIPNIVRPENDMTETPEKLSVMLSFCVKTVARNHDMLGIVRSQSEQDKSSSGRAAGHVMSIIPSIVRRKYGMTVTPEKLSVILSFCVKTVARAHDMLGIARSQSE